MAGAVGRQLLRGRNRLPGGAIERAVALLGNDQYHRARASSRSRRTRSLAASAGEPAIISVCLLRVGRAKATISCDGGSPPAAATLPDLFLLGRHDAFQRGVAKLVDAALDGQQRRQRHADPLKPAAFELAFHAQRRRRRSTCDLHDDRRVRHAEPLGQHHADLRVTLIVGLQAGQHQVERSSAHGRRERFGGHRGIGRRERVILNVDARGRRRAPVLRG